MKLVIAGGSGFLGRALIRRLLELRHSVTILSRNPDAARGRLPSEVSVVSWDARSVGSWKDQIDGADAVINLTGESIGNKRWTKRQKEILLSSRIDSTKAIVEAITSARQRPKTLINQSAVGYYGNVPDGDVTEDHPAGSDFLALVATQWEAEALKAEELGVRVVMPRTGVVLSQDGGALPRMLLPFRLFVGGPLGSGRQWFPWIHLTDEVAAFEFILQNSSLKGPVNLTAPESATMKQFCAILGRVMHRPSWAPVPGFVLKIILGEMAGPLLLGGQKVVPKKLLQAGYTFHYPNLEEALRNILTSGEG
ncbi:MAG TPA: TIGR01777 family oxidoreductase [Bacteroidota bacterium]|nr:TIGR01777 family oxidoreductase [Bacteroidota bacterium]